MTPRDDKLKKALSARPDAETYAVGYGKPPKETRFKPGQSGNPKGRPKGARNKPPVAAQLQDIILAEAYRTTTVREGKKKSSMPVAQAVVRSIGEKAATGDQRAHRLFTDLLKTAEREKSQEQAELFQAAVEYKDFWEKELEHRKRTGQKGPEPLPHPDHVKIDPRWGTVKILGPMSEEEKKKERDFLLKSKAQYEEELAVARQELGEPNCPYRDSVEREVAHTEKILGIIKRRLGEG